MWPHDSQFIKGVLCTAQKKIFFGGTQHPLVHQGGVENVQYATNHKRKFFYGWLRTVRFQRPLVHPSERSPTLPSSSGLCVRQIENEQQWTVGEVSQPLKVMALASRLALPDNAVPSLPGSDSWLSKKKQKKTNPELVPARLGAVKLHFRCCRNILDLVVNKHASITVAVLRSSRVWCWSRSDRVRGALVQIVRRPTSGFEKSVDIGG